MPCTTLRHLAIAMAALGGSAVLAQQAPVRLPAGEPYVLKIWDTSNGLPQNTVSDVLQMRNGMLWFGTFGGLCRFDGSTWRVFDVVSDEAFADSRITVLMESADERLWFGSELGVVSWFDEGRFRKVAQLPGGQVLHLEQLRDGRILAATPDDVFTIGAGGDHADASPPPFAGTPLPQVQTILERDSGELLFVGQQGVTSWRDGEFTKLSSRACLAASRAADGSEWIGTDQGLCRLVNGALVPVAGDDATSVAGKGVMSLHADRAGDTLWLGTHDGVTCLWLDGSRPPLMLPSIAAVKALRQDIAGGVWIGMEGGGLARLSRCEVQGFEVRDRTGKSSGSNSVIPDGADGWWVGAAAGLIHLRPGQPQRILGGETEKGIHGLFRDTDGTIWVGGQSWIGRVRGDQIERFGAPSAVGVVRAFLREPGGRLLLATDRGVMSVGETWTTWEPAAVLREESVKMMLPWADGSTWFVGVHKVLRVGARGETLTLLRRNHELPNVEVRGVMPGRGDRVWFGTYGGGFVGLDGGEQTIVGPKQGLIDAYVCMFAPVDAGWIVGGNRGPLLVNPTSLDDVADGKRSTIENRHLHCTNNISSEANGGVQACMTVTGDRAALCGVGGLLVVDLPGLAVAVAPPECHVEPILSSDQRLEGTGDDARIVVAANRTLVFACVAPEFDRPDAIQYHWRIGADAAWTQPTPLRSLSVSLPGPGEHLIEVRAIGNGETYSTPSTRVRVLVTPLLTESPWFFLLAAVTVVLVVWAGFRFGSRRSARQARRLQQLVDERTHEIGRARDSLEQRVVQRTEELQQALARLEADHAQRTLLEREIEQMRRMESLGQLAGGVAHDFNNLLTVVIGNVELLEFELGTRHESLELTRHIREAAARGREITQRLLAVASRQTVVPRVLDLAESLRANLGVLRDVMGGAVLVQLETTGEPLLVQASPGQIDQILMNLAVNARDAMPRGGVLRLSAEGTATHVRLSVQDTGAGMTPEVRQHAFEPFFTTKKGRGTGLGLASVYGITKQLQGEVVIESAPGEGSRFLFQFPRSSDAPGPAVIPRPPVGASNARVLLIEDEPDVRRAVRSLLELAQYRVVFEAENGAAAVHWLAEAATDVDVVVSDVRMPGLQGIELVHALRGIRPGLPMLFMSGHASSSNLLKELGPLGIEMVTKPPTREELSVAIERALAAVRPHPTPR